MVGLALPRSVLVHRFDAPEGSILLIHNLPEEPVTIDLSGVDTGKRPYDVFSDTAYEPLPSKLSQLSLGGSGYRWIRLRRGQ